MKVLLITRKLSPPTNLGAVPTIVGAVARGLADMGAEVDVIAGPSSSPCVERLQDNLTIHRIDDQSGSLGMTRLLSTVKALCSRVDIVHVHDVLPLGTGFLNWVSGFPVSKLWTVHNFSGLCTNSVLWPPCSLSRERIASGPPELCYVDRSPSCRNCFPPGGGGWARYSAFVFRSHLARRAARRFQLITPSHASAEVLMRAWGLRAKVLPNPVALSSLSSPRWDGNALSIFFGGRLVPEKGLDTLMESMEQLRDLGPTLTVSGTGRPRYLRALEDLARRLGIQYARTDWHQRDQYLQDLMGYKICVVPTRGFEVFGMVALDAEMAGLPLVLADQGGLKEVARGGKNAIYFRSGDARSLAEAIRTLAGDAAMRRRYASRSRKIVRRYGLEHHLRQLIRMYEELASDGTTRFHS